MVLSLPLRVVRAHRVLVPKHPADGQLAHVRAPADEHRQPQEEHALLKPAKLIDALRGESLYFLA